MKELDGNLPTEIDEFLKKNRTDEPAPKSVTGDVVVVAAPVAEDLTSDTKQMSLVLTSSMFSNIGFVLF